MASRSVHSSSKKPKVLNARVRLIISALNARKRRHFKYTIHPPMEFPFLPSDESLRMIVGRTPRIRFVECVRFPDRDYLIVRGVEDNPLRTVASPAGRQEAKRFRHEIAASALAEREVRPDIREAAERLFREYGFIHIEWNAGRLVMYDENRYRYEKSSALSGDRKSQFKSFARLCRGELPFSYGAAF